MVAIGRVGVGWGGGGGGGFVGDFRGFFLGQMEQTLAKLNTAIYVEHDRDFVT